MKKLFFVLLFLLILLKPLFAADTSEVWQLATADVSLITDDAKKLKPEGTPLGQLLVANKRNLWSMMEENGNVLTLVIVYTPANRKTIKQIAFYRTFDLSIQQELELLGIRNKPIQVKIGYLKDNPLIIRFFVKKNLVKMPPLVQSD